jgi:Leucine-rich repeat (LRR) protein
MKLYKNLNSALKERQEVQALKLTIQGEDFPVEILDFPHLMELYLDGNCRSFPQNLYGFKELKILSIKWTSFTGDLSSIFHLPNLENIKILETPMKFLLLPLGHSVAPVKSLTIKNCGLTTLPEEISIFSELTELNLSGNKLQSLPSSLRDLTKLKRLNLDKNDFSIFPDHIRKNSSLSHVSIDQNLFSQDERDRIQREFNLSVQ